MSVPPFEIERLRAVPPDLIVLNDLNPLGLEHGTFVIIKGHVDESISADQRLFTFSAVIAEGIDWMWFDVDWQNCIEQVNRKLKKEGRKQISRYHASDCSSREGEFAGWTTDEQISLTQQLLNVFRNHYTKTIAYTVDLREFIEVFPEGQSDPLRTAYTVLTKFLMFEIGEWLHKLNPKAKITLIHDRCQYNGTILQSFDKLKDDPSFKHRSCFTTLAPMSWEDCRLLQSADLLAFENMKEVERQGTNRPRRKTLELLLDLDTFGGRARYLDRETIGEIHKIMKVQRENLLW